MEPRFSDQNAEARQLLKKLLADIDLAVTLLNLELKWMRGDKTVSLERLAEANAQLQWVLRLREEYAAKLTTEQPPDDRLIPFPKR